MMNVSYIILLIQEYRGTRNPELCRFPFKFRGREYHTCTTVEDPDQKHWCAVEVDEDGHAEEMRWGHCDDSCLSIEPEGMPHFLTYTAQDWLNYFNYSNFTLIISR